MQATGDNAFVWPDNPPDTKTRLNVADSESCVQAGCGTTIRRLQVSRPNYGSEFSFYVDSQQGLNLSAFAKFGDAHDISCNKRANLTIRPEWGSYQVCLSEKKIASTF